MRVSLAMKLMQKQGPAKGLIELGAQTMATAPDGSLLVGGGTGLLCIAAGADDDGARGSKIPIKSAEQVGSSPITSLAVDAGSWDGRRYTVFVGCASSDIYRMVVDSASGKMASEIVQTAHRGPINDLAFPYEYSECFATGEGTLDETLDGNSRAYLQRQRIAS